MTGALVCDFELALAAFELRHGPVFGGAFVPQPVALQPLAADGLVEVSPPSIHVEPRDRLLVRTVATLFDRHLRESRAAARYSSVS